MQCWFNPWMQNPWILKANCTLTALSCWRSLLILFCKGRSCCGGYRSPWFIGLWEKAFCSYSIVSALGTWMPHTWHLYQVLISSVCIPTLECRLSEGNALAWLMGWSLDSVLLIMLMYSLLARWWMEGPHGQSEHQKLWWGWAVGIVYLSLSCKYRYLGQPIYSLIKRPLVKHASSGTAEQSGF